MCSITTIAPRSPPPQMSMTLSDFQKWVKEVVRVACEDALQAEEFVPDPIDDHREGNIDRHTVTLLCSTDVFHRSSRLVCLVSNKSSSDSKPYRVTSPPPPLPPLPSPDSPLLGGPPVPPRFSPMGGVAAAGAADSEEPELMQLDTQEKMTYTEQAAKRKHCQRLTRSAWLLLQ